MAWYLQKTKTKTNKKTQAGKSMELNRRPGISPCNGKHLIFNKEAQNILGGKHPLQKNGDGKTGHSHVKSETRCPTVPVHTVTNRNHQIYILYLY
jgi:hypothetical protein